MTIDIFYVYFGAAMSAHDMIISYVAAPVSSSEQPSECGLRTRNSPWPYHRSRNETGTGLSGFLISLPQDIWGQPRGRVPRVGAVRGRSLSILSGVVLVGPRRRGFSPANKGSLTGRSGQTGKD